MSARGGGPCQITRAWEERLSCPERTVFGMVAFLPGSPGGAAIKERILPASPEGPLIRMFARGLGAKVKKEMSSLEKSSWGRET